MRLRQPAGPTFVEGFCSFAGAETNPSVFPAGVEFHGPLNSSSFNNEDLEKTGANTRAKISEIKAVLNKTFRIDTISSRIEASNRLHEAAVEDGENKRDVVVNNLIKP